MNLFLATIQSHLTTKDTKVTQRWLLAEFALQVILALMVGAPITVFAQDSSTGAIRGVIRDPSHALAAGVSISARNVATNELRVTVSDSQGNYLLDFLAPGSYQLSANPRGFKLQPLSPRKSKPAKWR